MFNLIPTPLLLAPLVLDGYKTCHPDLYPAGTEYVYSNNTARKSRVEGVEHHVQFGVQYFCQSFLIDYYQASFFGRPVAEVLDEYRTYLLNYNGFVREAALERLAALHDLGYLPIRIKTLPEGTLVPIQVASLTIENTHPDFGWLTNSLETILSDTIWPMCTSATTAARFRQLLTRFADDTVGNRDFVPWQGHDFSMRGTFGFEAAVMSGAAHLLSFTGTDTIPAIAFLRRYYGARFEDGVIGGSIPASEHAVTCAGGDVNERETVKRWITEIYPNGNFSAVGDTWDYWNFLTQIIPSLKAEILARDGKVVIRPDSGDGVEIVAGKAVPIELTHQQFDEMIAVAQEEAGEDALGGKLADLLFSIQEDLMANHKFDSADDDFYVRTTDGVFYKTSECDHDYGFCTPRIVPATPELMGTIEFLWQEFGGTVNAKGFKELDPHVGCILGEGVGLKNGEEILQRLKDKGFASTNIVFGVGSYAYQYVTRDTYGFAIKATECVVQGERHAIYKNPKTDTGAFKKSAKGRVQVYREDGVIKMRDQVTVEESNEGLLETVFENGQMVKTTTLAEIRARLAAELDRPAKPDLSEVSAQGAPATGELAQAA